MIFLGATLAVRAIEPTEWKNRQPLTVERAGLLRLVLPPETLGLARPGREDLRLLDPAGREVPYVIEEMAPYIPPLTAAPKSVVTTLTNSSTQLLIETGSTEPLSGIALATPAPDFMKAVQIEILDEQGRWAVYGTGAPIFRRFGTEQLRLNFIGIKTARVRLTIDDVRSRALPFTGTTLFFTPGAQLPPVKPIPVRIVRREEFAGESVLTLDLGGANIPLAGLAFTTSEPLFERSVAIATRELREETATERVLASGTIWRVATEGVPPTARLDVPVNLITPSRELLVHLVNGDSPPLAIDEVTASQRPLGLVFRAADPGTYAVLTGNAQAAAPRYDLATLATALRDTPPSDLTPGPAAPNPGYHPPADALADTPLRGAALDPAPWNFRKPVRLAGTGVQQLELDLDVLAGAQSAFGDLRLVREGAQVPFLLERPNLSRTSQLTVTSADDPKRPRVSRWQLKLPRATLPVTRLTLTSPTALFQRHLRFFEKISDERRGDTFERPLADADWSHTPGNTRSLTLSFGTAPAGDTFLLETDNGDNPPIALTGIEAAYPVARLLFKTEAGAASPTESNGLALYYGNRAAAAPRYDLALVAGQIFAAEKLVATLGAEETAHSGGWADKALAGSSAGILFWGVLAVVVIGLLLVVAKLLPKPPAPPA